MQAVLDFLMEYFYWILGVLVILLITVIGFLADTKRKKKLRDRNSGENTNNSSQDFNVNMGGMNMNNDLNNVNMGMDNNMMNGMNTMPNMGMNDLNNITPDMNMGVNNLNTVPNTNLNMMNNEPINMPNQMEKNTMSSVNEIPTTPVESAPSNDSFFTPASEQTPTFAPRDVTIPTPVEPAPIVNNNVNPVNSWDMQGTANVSPVEVTPTVATTEVQASDPNIGPSMGQEQVSPLNNINVNPTSSFGTASAPVAPIVPETPVMPVETTVNMNVMPETTPHVEPVVNPEMNSQVPNVGLNINQGQVEQVPPVTPNFVTGVKPNNNMPNENTNLNG